MWILRFFFLLQVKKLPSVNSTRSTKIENKFMQKNQKSFHFSTLISKWVHPLFSFIKNHTHYNQKIYALSGSLMIVKQGVLCHTAHGLAMYNF